MANIDALKKVALDNEGTAVNGMLLALDEKLWNAKNVDELCQILDKTKIIFESVGKTIV